MHSRSAILKISRAHRLVALPLAVLAFAAIWVTVSSATGSGRSTTSPDIQEFVVEARQFSYSPSVIHVAEGQRVRITLRAMDVTHGLALDEFGIQVKAVPGRPDQIEFVADKSGAFPLRCTQTCGVLHPFMAGRLVVSPNVPFQTSLALAVLLTASALCFLWLRRDSSSSLVQGGATHTVWEGTAVAAASNTHGAVRFDLLALRGVSRFLRWRGFQFAMMLPLLVLMVLVVTAGLRGTPVGSHNIAIVFVWLLWWPLLMILLVPLGGRLWCAVCPVPGPGEWLQRRAFIARGPMQLLSLGRRWPAKLRGMWLQNAAFLIIALTSTVVLTTPMATATVLIAFFALALTLALVFPGRVFCRYLCPLGGFIGLCSLAAPLALRVKDEAVCVAHREKECVKGSGAGYGCPWFEYPGTLRRNAYCGLCAECLKTCPKKNIAIGLQPAGHDLVVGSGRLDEAFRTFIALASAALYSAVMLGPWGWLKMLAGNPLAPYFALYAALLLGTSLVVVPGIFLFAAWWSRSLSGTRHMPATRLWQDFSYSLVPLTLAAWIAFSLSLVFTSGHYVLPVLSDPLGHGWNLFGTAGFEGGPVLMGLLPFLQVAALLTGLAWSIGIGWQLARRSFPAPGRALRALVPVALFLLGTTATFLWLFLGGS